MSADERPSLVAPDTVQSAVDRLISTIVVHVAGDAETMSALWQLLASAGSICGSGIGGKDGGEAEEPGGGGLLPPPAISSDLLESTIEACGTMFAIAVREGLAKVRNAEASGSGNIADSQNGGYGWVDDALMRRETASSRGGVEVGSPSWFGAPRGGDGGVRGPSFVSSGASGSGHGEGSSMWRRPVSATDMGSSPLANGTSVGTSRIQGDPTAAIDAHHMSAGSRATMAAAGVVAESTASSQLLRLRTGRRGKDGGEVHSLAGGLASPSHGTLLERGRVSVSSGGGVWGPPLAPSQSLDAGEGICSGGGDSSRTWSKGLLWVGHREASLSSTARSECEHSRHLVPLEASAPRPGDGAGRPERSAFGRFMDRCRRTRTGRGEEDLGKAERYERGGEGHRRGGGGVGRGRAPGGGQGVGGRDCCRGCARVPSLAAGSRGSGVEDRLFYSGVLGDGRGDAGAAAAVVERRVRAAGSQRIMADAVAEAVETASSWSSRSGGWVGR